jgi:alkylation response protein AidB-like acyl-CoA dehydrogenase
MRFALDAEQQLLQDVIRATLERDAPLARIRQWGDSEDLAPFNHLAARQGWSGIGVDDHIGGQGGGMVERAILFEQLGRAAAPNGGLLTSMLALDCGVADKALIAGTTQVAVMHAADRSPDCLADIRVDGGSVAGTAALVLNAPAADQLVIPIATGPTVELWAVDASAATIADVRLVDRTRRLGEVTVNCPATPVAELTADRFQHAAARAATLVAADSLGLARRTLDLTVSYVREREQFGVAVGSFQAVKHAAAQMLVDIEATHSGVYYAAWALEHNQPDGEISAWIAKAFGTQTASKVADTALQLHGAIGYTWEYNLHVLFKRAKANVELYGPPRWYRGRIADALHLTSSPA